MCRDCYDKKHAKPESYITKVCPICNSKFTVHKGQIKSGYGIYCSVSCARIGRPTRKRTRIKVVCENCGKEFEKHKSEIKRDVHDKNFCSLECWYEYNRGNNHYGYCGGQNERMNSEYHKWHNAVIERDKGYCRLCHSQKRLEVHHIYRFAIYPNMRWDIENGITLCHDCHIKFRNKEDDYINTLMFVASVPLEVWHV
jgi:hypothetical protein